MSQASTPDPRLGDLGESGVLAEVFAALPPLGPDVLVGPGDDTALLRTPGQVLVTTDAMVRGRDWRDDWSSAADVGAKAVVQNLADLAAMGGVGIGMVVTLIAPPSLPMAWARGLVEGITAAAAPRGVPVVGGDLSSSDGDAVVVSVTALGRLPGPGPVLRSGARLGQVLAVSHALGRSGAGWWLLREQDAATSELGEQAMSLVAYHRRPDPDLDQGPIAAAAGASCLIDVSDGLVRDAGRIATASGVDLVLDPQAITAMALELQPAVPEEVARECVLGGGEEHCLLGAFAAADLPPGWHAIGRVRDATGKAGVRLDGQVLNDGGWDHFETQPDEA